MSGDRREVWYSVSITADRKAETALETAFGILDPGGVETDLLGKIADESVCVTGYFETEPFEPDVRSAVESALEIHRLDAGCVSDIVFAEVVQKDWLEEWKKHWKPTVVGSFVVRPPWRESPDKNAIDIVIDPSMAFGTGTHETTKLCLSLIEEYFKPEMSFLDIGTGTGILSIAAAKLASSETRGDFYAIDNDADSIVIAKENAVSNGAVFIQFENSELDEDAPVFDFVCANMTIDVISPILELLFSKTGSILVLSGILIEQESKICSQINSLGFNVEQVLRDGEWCAIAIHKQT